MPDHVYKMLEVVGSSGESTDAAIRNALAHVAESESHMNWFEVVETRGHIENGKVAHFQVKLKVGCRVVP